MTRHKRRFRASGAIAAFLTLCFNASAQDAQPALEPRPDEIEQTLEQASSVVTFGGVVSSSLGYRDLSRAASGTGVAIAGGDILYKLYEGDVAGASGRFVETGTGVILVPAGTAIGTAIAGPAGGIFAGQKMAEASKWLGKQETYRQLRQTNLSKLPLHERMKAVLLNKERFLDQWYSTNASTNHYRAQADLYRELSKRERELYLARGQGSAVPDQLLQLEIERLDALADQFDCENNPASIDAHNYRQFDENQLRARQERLRNLLDPIVECRSRGFLPICESLGPIDYIIGEIQTISNELRDIGEQRNRLSCP